MNAVTRAEEELLALTASTQSAATALEKARMALKTARAALASSIARFAADQAKFGDTPEAQKLALARKAGQAEREATVADAEAALAAAIHAMSVPASDTKAADALKKAQTTAQAALTKAEAARANPKSPEAYTSMTSVFPAQSTGRRKALAEWLTRRDHPLTARVAVNHLWMRHFQEPLVASVFDFGRNGAKPTNPALLDWLAAELMENGWSMQHLHRLIVTSAAYRRSSRTGFPTRSGDELENSSYKDPDNHFLWRMNSSRMEAEVVRDSVLHLAGALDPKMGGQELENTEAETSARRSLYFSCHPEVGGRSAMAAMFDAPEPTDCYRRTSSVLPQQALVMTNSKLVHDHSAALARQIGADTSDFITAAFEHILSRTPTEVELVSCRHFLKQGSKESLVRVLLNHNDFVTVR
jgi:hypothetical protein